MVTIHDVAKAAGVSIATVSACINASAPVSPALRRRVNDAVAATGYRPDALARSLKTGVTRTLGLAVESLGSPFAAAVAQAAVRAAAEKGYAMLLAHGLDLAGLEARRVDGILALPATSAPLEGLPGARCPVAVAGVPAEGCDSIAADHAGMAEAAVEHLAGLAHRRIALVVGPAHVPQGERILEGYRRALDRHGIRFQPRLVRVAAPGKAKTERQDQARDIARALLAASDWPSALIVCGETLALGMLGATAAAGIACPAGMSILALGDGDWMAHAMPPLTAIAEPAREIGGGAVKLLLDRIGGGIAPAARHVLVPGALSVRGSTAPASVRD